MTTPLQNLVREIKIYPDGKMDVQLNRGYVLDSEDKSILEFHLKEASRRWHKGTELIYVPINNIKDIRQIHPLYYDDGEM